LVIGSHFILFINYTMHLLFLLAYLSLLYNIIIDNPFFMAACFIYQVSNIFLTHIYAYVHIHIHILRLNLTDDTLKYLVYMDRWIRYLVALLSLLAIKSYSLFIHLSLLQQYT
jgi:hypothetical protein